MTTRTESEVLEPEWLTASRRYIGQREYPGKKHNPIILDWLKRLGAWWRDDETPWCGVFVAAMLRDVIVSEPPPKHYYRARAWLDWGYPPYPDYTLGAVTILERKGGGHVGFLVGVSRNRDGQVTHVSLLGGNQDNMVSVRSYPVERVMGYRMPMSYRADLVLAPTIEAASGSTEA